MGSSARKFNARAFVALVIAFSALGLPVTGIAVHVHGFLPLSVVRHAWMSAHNILGVLFVAFSIWHIVLNQRALWNHIKGVAARIPVVSREAMLAGVVVAVLLFLSVGHAFRVGGQ